MAAGENDIDQPSRPLSLFRLVVDPTRLTDEVEHYAYKGAGTEQDPYIVSFIPNDPGNPFTWSKRLKWTISLTVAIEVLATAFASSAYSGTLRELLAEFETSTTVITGGLSLFVLGFALGPLVWAPLSEMYGRQVIFFITFGAFTAFNAGVIASQNVATLLVLRFFAGAFGSSPFTNAGGVIADVFTASERGLAMSIFALAPSMGPTLGPFIGGFLGESEGWRWVMGLLTFFSGALWILGSLLVPETYAPVILRKRATALSQRSGKVYMLQSEKDKGRASTAEVMKISLLRPWVLLFMEPIVLLLSLYMAVVYGTLYLLFGAYPIVFQLTRGWGEGVGGLPFLGVALGMVLALVFMGWANKEYLKVAEEHGGVAPAEARLPVTLYGSIAIPIGLFWFAWTNGPNVHWISPVLAGAPFGFGLNLMFLGITNYLIDSYTIFAASTLAANTVLRSLFGAAFPLFTRDMFDALGIHWGSSIPAFLSVACIPFPFIFYKYGASIRARCVYAAQSEAVMQQLRAGETVDPIIQVTTQTSDSSTGMESEEKETRATTPRRSDVDVDRLQLARTRSRAGSISEAANYQISPYDIDRVHTTASVAGVDLKRVKTNKSSGR